MPAIRCPECGETFTRKPTASGRVRCPECGEAFTPRATRRTGIPIWIPLVAVGSVLLLAAGGVAGWLLWPKDARPEAKDPAKPITTAPDPFRPDQPTDPQQNAVDTGDPKNEPPLAGVPPVLVLDPGGHSRRVRAVEFMPGGARFVTACEDKTVRVWDTITGECLKTIRLPNAPGQSGAVHVLAASPDGKHLVAGGRTANFLRGSGTGQDMAYLIVADSGHIVRAFDGHSGDITAVSFSPDGAAVATASGFRMVRVCDTKSGTVKVELPGSLHPHLVHRVRFHPDGVRLATACEDGIARIWTPGRTDQEHRAVELKPSGKLAPLRDLVWAADGKTLYTAGDDGIVRSWDEAGKLLREYDPCEESARGKASQVKVRSLALTKAGTELVVGGAGAAGGWVGVLDLTSGKCRAIGGHTAPVMSVTASPTADLVVSVGGDMHTSEVRVWKLADGATAHERRTAFRPVFGLATAGTGTIAFGTEDKGDRLPFSRALTAAFDLTKLEFVPVPKKVVGPQDTLGPYQARFTDDGQVEVTANGRPQLSTAIDNVPRRIHSATLIAGRENPESPLEPRHLLVGSSNGLQLWNPKGKCSNSLYRTHGEEMLAVAPLGEGMFVTASTDHTFQVWRLDDPDPVLSLYVQDREWVAWTPQGYYAASPGGERLMGWQLNTGRLRVGSYHPAARFRQTLYQPAVIRHLLPAKGDLKTAIQLAVAETKRPVPAVKVSDVLPPDVVIATPTATGTATSDKETLSVTATATGDAAHPVKSMRLLVNGRPFQGVKGVKAFDPPKAGGVSATWEVALPPGKHTLAVQADNGASAGLSAPLEVTQTGTTAKPSLYVLAVGVDDYPDPLKLKFAVSDATAMQKVFRDRTSGVFDKVEVKLLTNKEATRKAITDGLDWLQTEMTPKDVAVFYFSGHGGRASDGSFHLVPADVDLKWVSSATGVSAGVVKDKLSAIPGRVLAVFDACHSGAAAASPEFGRVDGLVRELVADDCGVAVLCSSLAREVSFEGAAAGGGFFTASLLAGLNGKADSNGDGVVTTHELADFTATHVRKESGGLQHPTGGFSPYLKPFPLTTTK